MARGSIRHVAYGVGAVVLGGLFGIGERPREYLTQEQRDAADQKSDGRLEARRRRRMRTGQLPPDEIDLREQATRAQESDVSESTDADSASSDTSS